MQRWGLSDASTSQGSPRTARNCQDPGESTGRFSHRAPTQTCQHPDSRFLNVRECIYIVLGHTVLTRLLWCYGPLLPPVCSLAAQCSITHPLTPTVLGTLHVPHPQEPESLPRAGSKSVQASDPNSADLFSYSSGGWKSKKSLQGLKSRVSKAEFPPEAPQAHLCPALLSF